MGIVLVDWYRVTCKRCGFRASFKISGGQGTLAGAQQGRRIHTDLRPDCRRTGRALRIGPVLNQGNR